VHAYGKKGGELYITVRAYSDRRITVEIKDKGRGIEDVKKAMEPLYTTDKSGERSGIGFAVMQSFTDSVRVRSTPGKGTSVTLVKRLSSEE
jgi:stage II sporulation protein AB (anti-sigma F factor)